MPKFCNQCGRPLQPDEICRCKEAKAKVIEEKSKKPHVIDLSMRKKLDHGTINPGIDKSNIDNTLDIDNKRDGDNRLNTIDTTWSKESDENLLRNNQDTGKSSERNESKYDIGIDTQDFKTGEINIQYIRGGTLKEYIRNSDINANKSKQTSQDRSKRSISDRDDRIVEKKGPYLEPDEYYNIFRDSNKELIDSDVNRSKRGLDTEENKESYGIDKGVVEPANQYVDINNNSIDIAEIDIITQYDDMEVSRSTRNTFDYVNTLEEEGQIDNSERIVNVGQFDNTEQTLYNSITSNGESAYKVKDMAGVKDLLSIEDSISETDSLLAKSLIGSKDLKNITDLKNSDETKKLKESSESENKKNLEESGSPETLIEKENSGKQLIAKMIIGITSYCKNFLGLFLNTFKTPAESLSEYAESGDSKVAITYIGIEALAFALFLVSVFIKFNDLIARELGGLLSMLQLSGYDESFPIIRIFIVSVILSLSFHIVLAGLLVVFHKVMLKIVYPYNRMLRAVSVRAVVLIPFLLAAAAISRFSPGIGIFIYFIGGILTYYFMGETLKKSREINANKTIYLLFFAIVITIAIIFIVLLFGYEIYLPDRIMTTWWE